jgi:hypothetical protein
MTGFNIVMVIAVILFARLGVRLFTKWQELKNGTSDKANSKSEKK